MVGAARETGTSMLIEDVACPVQNLAEMTMDLNDMFQRYGYEDACCLGHALEGNLHLIFSQVCLWNVFIRVFWIRIPVQFTGLYESAFFVYLRGC